MRWKVSFFFVFLDRQIVDGEPSMLGIPLALTFVCHACKQCEHFGTWLYLTVQNPLYLCLCCCLFCFVCLFCLFVCFVLFVLPVCLPGVLYTCYHVSLSAVWPQCGPCRSYLLCYNTGVRSGHHPYWTHN